VGSSPVYCARGEATLLSDSGPSPRFEEVRRRALDGVDPTSPSWAYAVKFDAWVSARAAEHV